MILACNIGNTRIDFGVFQEGELIRDVFSIPTIPHETSLAFAVRLKQALAFSLKECVPEDAVLSSVVPSLSGVASDALTLLCQKKPILIAAGVKTGLRLAIDDPGSVAADLVAMAVAVKEEYALPAVIVSFGTATTITLVDETGAFRGGAILPGIEISEEALIHHAALLYHVDLTLPQSAIATSTAGCVKSGVLYGAAGAVDGIIRRFEKESTLPLSTVIVTGRLCDAVFDTLEHRGVKDKKLLLKGLCYLYQKNRKINA